MMEKITHFKFSIGGFTQGTVWLEQADVNIKIRCNNCNDNGIFTPSQDDWTSFSASLSLFNFWKWKKNYNDPHVCDGTQWELSIQKGSHNLKCYGSNNYPQDFNKFVSSVNQLLGSNVFDSDVQIPKIRLVRKPGKCRECSSNRIARIQYGYPDYTPELEKSISDGQVVLGGCCQEIDDPAWQCGDCDCLFYRKLDGAEIFEIDEPMRFSAKLLGFIKEENWVYAKTMPEWPHEYLVRDRVDEDLFEELIRHIRANGHEGKFYSKTLIYYDEDGLVYWTMGAPIEDTVIINRCRKADTYESRLLKGTLPE